MNRALLQSWNALPAPDALRPGMHLKVSDRHVVPRRGSDGIVIDIAVRTLYWFQKGALRARFPIGVGRTDWGTPPGHYRIVGRRQDPVWHVPPSIQAEMRAQGEKVVGSVPPGPDNPLGKYWIQLSAPGYGLHGTNAPASIGKYVSHGCMRLLPEHVELLYREARDGTPVDIIYEPVKLARDPSRRVFLEVHRDVLGAQRSELPTVLDFIQAAGLTEAVDATRVVDAVARAWGTPEDVSLQPPAEAAEGDGDPPVLARGADRDAAAGRRVLDGVAEQVGHHALELRLVGDQRRQRLRLQREPDAFAAGSRAVVLDGVGQHGGQVEGPAIERHAARLDAREVQEVAHQRVDRLAALADAGQDVGRD